MIKRKRDSVVFSTIFLTAVGLLQGCTVVSPAPDYYRPDVVYSDAIPEPVITDIAPPPPQYEVVGVPPAPGYFWISGIWIWQGGHHVWRPGRWSAPRPGYDWQPHRWRQDGQQWRMDGGHWVKQRQR